MAEWNPCEGLKEIGFEDIRVGDVIRTYCKHGEFQSCVQHVVNGKQRTPTNLRFQTDSVKEVIHYIADGPSFYLVERPVVEPTDRGDVVEIYRPNPVPNENEQVEIYIRVRAKSLDESFGSPDAWTDDANSKTLSWQEIVGRSELSDTFALRTFKATYKEDV